MLCNVGNCDDICRELFCAEHGVKPDGTTEKVSKSKKDEEGAAFHTFFSESESGRQVTQLHTPY